MERLGRIAAEKVQALTSTEQRNSIAQVVMSIFYLSSACAVRHKHRAGARILAQCHEWASVIYLPSSPNNADH